MSILESIKQKVQTEQQAAASKRRAVWTEYRRLIAKLDGLKSGEESRLESLVVELGINPAHIEAHAAILVAFDAAQKTGASVEAVGAEVAAEEQRRGALYQRLATITAEVRESEGKKTALLAQFDQALTARDDVGKLRSWFRELLGGADTPVTKGDLPRCLIDNPTLRDQLGIVQATPWEPGHVATPEDVARRETDHRVKMVAMKNQLGKDRARLEERTRARDSMETNPDAREAYEAARLEVEQLSQSVKAQAARLADAEAA